MSPMENSSNMLSREEKERILRTLEVDREFRYALMGLLGFKEVLGRVTRIEERQQVLEERFAKLGIDGVLFSKISDTIQ